jgi:hypothetical protein
VKTFEAFQTLPIICTSGLYEKAKTIQRSKCLITSDVRWNGIVTRLEWGGSSVTTAGGRCGVLRMGLLPVVSVKQGNLDTAMLNGHMPDLDYGRRLSHS